MAGLISDEQKAKIQRNLETIDDFLRLQAELIRNEKEDQPDVNGAGSREPSSSPGPALPALTEAEKDHYRNQNPCSSEHFDIDVQSRIFRSGDDGADFLKLLADEAGAAIGRKPQR